MYKTAMATNISTFVQCINLSSDFLKAVDILEVSDSSVPTDDSSCVGGKMGLTTETFSALALLSSTMKYNGSQ